MDLRVSSIESDHVELFGYSHDDQVRVFIRLTYPEAYRLFVDLGALPKGAVSDHE